MAIRNADGSIILTTQIDTSGLSKSFNSLKKIATAIGAAFSVRRIVQFSNESAKLATQVEANTQRLIDIYGSASKAVGDFIDQNALALGMSRSAAAGFSAVYGNLFSVWADQATNAELSNRYLNMTAVVASKTGRTVEDVQERIRSGLLGNTEAIEDLGIFVNVKTIEMTEAFQRVANGRSWEQLNGHEQQQVRTLAILEQATLKYGSTVSNTSALTRNRFEAALQDFKATWGQLVNTVLVPVLEILTQIIVVATQCLQFIAGISGETVKSSQAQADEIEKSVKNQQGLTKEIKATNKAQEKSLANFDEINKLSSGATAASPIGLEIPESPPGDGIDTGGISSKLAELMSAIGISLAAVGLVLLFMGNIAWGIGFVIAGATVWSVSEYSQGQFDYATITNTLDLISEYIGGALITIGIILLFLGNIPWAIGFIIGGALVYGVKEAASEGGFNAEDITTSLGTILEYVRYAMMALGVLLIFFGHIPLGIGFIFAGAALEEIQEQSIEGEGEATSKIDKFIQDNEKLIVGVAVALLAIGMILIAMGIFTPLSFGILIAGATALKVTEQSTNEDIGKLLTDFFTENAELVAGISAALLILGILLLSLNLQLAISLIAAGAVGLVTVTILNWEAIVNTIKEFIFENATLIALISGGLLILGIILCCTGVGLPLGIALIAAGAIGLVTVTALSWDSIVEWISGAWDAVKGFWDKYIAPIFTLDFWLDLAKSCGNGLIAGFEGAINGIIGLFETMINWVVDGLNKISFEVPDWVPMIGGSTFGFNIPRVQFGRVSIPRLATGAVIPPNKEFLAVLGDQKQGVNIETPLTTMIEAFNIALDSRGGNEHTETILEIDGEKFGRLIYRLNKQQSRRVGVNFSEV